MSIPPEQPSESAFAVLADEERTAPRTALEREYGAALMLGGHRVAVNFVTTIDGIASFGLRSDDSRAVGGGVLADRLLMAMLRAVAGAIVVGAGTLRATLNHQWTADALVPSRSGELAELRSASGRPPAPAPLVIVSASGAVPAHADAIASPATPVHVLSSRGFADARQVAEVASAARSDDPRAADTPPVQASSILDAARSLAGGGPVLCEGGPHLLGTLLNAGVPLDLFLTVAPQLAGRHDGASDRLSLVEGVELSAFTRRGTLRSIRRASSHLLLRYAIDPAPTRS